jgi:hypothetical protein
MQPVELQVLQIGEQTIHRPLAESVGAGLVYVPSAQAEKAVWKRQRAKRANNIFCIEGSKVIFIT